LIRGNEWLYGKLEEEILGGEKENISNIFEGKEY